MNWKSIAMTAGIALLAVYVYNNFIRPNFSMAPSIVNGQ
jgi:hypothetical protein